MSPQLMISNPIDLQSTSEGLVTRPSDRKVNVLRGSSCFVWNLSIRFWCPRRGIKPINLLTLFEGNVAEICVEFSGTV